MIEKIINKKILAILMLMIMLVGTIQPVFSVSSTGTGKWVAGQWDSRIFTTENKNNVGMLLRRLVNYNTGEKITVFCGEHFINSPTGTIESATHSVPSNPAVQRACKVADCRMV